VKNSGWIPHKHACASACSLSLSVSLSFTPTHTHTHTHIHTYIQCFFLPKIIFAIGIMQKWEEKNTCSFGLLIFWFPFWRQEHFSLCVCVCECCLSWKTNVHHIHLLMMYTVQLSYNTSLPLHFLRLVRYLKEYLSLILTDNRSSKNFHNLCSRWILYFTYISLIWKVIFCKVAIDCWDFLNKKLMVV